MLGHIAIRGHAKDIEVRLLDQLMPTGKRVARHRLVGTIVQVQDQRQQPGGEVTVEAVQQLRGLFEQPPALCGQGASLQPAFLDHGLPGVIRDRDTRRQVQRQGFGRLLIGEQKVL